MVLAAAEEERQRLRDLCDLLQEMRALAEARPVDFFARRLWETSLPRGWGDALLRMNEEQLLGLPTLQSDFTDASLDTGSLPAYVAAARRLCLGRNGDWTVELHEKGQGGGKQTSKKESFAVGARASRHLQEQQTGRRSDMYKFMSSKKKEEVMGVQGLVTGMVRLHGSTTICDIGSGKGYLSHVIGQTTPGVRVVAIDSKQGFSTAADRRSRFLSRRVDPTPSLAIPLAEESWKDPDNDHTDEATQDNAHGDAAEDKVRVDAAHLARTPEPQRAARLREGRASAGVTAGRSGWCHNAAAESLAERSALAGQVSASRAGGVRIAAVAAASGAAAEATQNWAHLALRGWAAAAVAAAEAGYGESPSSATTQALSDALRPRAASIVGGVQILEGDAHACVRRGAGCPKLAVRHTPEGGLSVARAKLEHSPPTTRGKNSGVSALSSSGAATFRAVTAFVEFRDPLAFLRVIARNQEEGRAAVEGEGREGGRDGGRALSGEVMVPEERVTLMGLHTCGDLGPSVVRLFSECAGADALVLVGCCYHKLSQHPLAGTAFGGGSPDTWPAPGWNGRCGCDNDASRAGCLAGFPLSKVVREKGIWLDENSLSLANFSAGERVPDALDPRRGYMEHRQACYHSTFCRAVFQVLWFSRFQSTLAPARRSLRPALGRTSQCYPSFTAWVRAAMTALEVPHSCITDDEIGATHDALLPQLEHLRRFLAIRASLASLVESVLLLDRVCYLLEQPGVGACAVPVFDAHVSPRNVAIVASKLFSPVARRLHCTA